MNQDRIIFSTGKSIYPNRGIIGLSPGFEIGEGYDSLFDTYEVPGSLPFEDYQLTKEEQLELCILMSGRWLSFMELLRHEAAENRKKS